MNSLETLRTAIDFYKGNEYTDLSDAEKADVDTRYRNGWIKKFEQEKAEGTLPQELSQYNDPGLVYDHYIGEAKKANPGLSTANSQQRVNEMGSHEFADNVERYKNTSEFKNLSEQDKAGYNSYFGDMLSQKRAAEGIEEPAPDFNANSSINNDTIKEWLNIEPENQPTETKKDLGLLDTTGTMIKAGAKSLARGVPNILSTGLGAAGYASDVLGKATGSDYLSDQGEMLSTLGNALRTSTRNLLPPEQKGAESLEEMWNRGLGGNLIALADEAPEQLLTWVIPYLGSSYAAKAVEAAKKGAKAGNVMTAVNKALAKLSPEKAAKYAGLLGSMGLELSDIHQTELQEEGRMNAPLTTTLAGMAAGAMENIVPAGLLKLSKGWSTATRQALRKAASGPKEFAKFALSQAGKNFLEEFSTEAAQTAIEQMAAKYNSTGELGISRKFGEAQQILKAEGIAGLAKAAAQDKDLAEIFDAAVVGGITGGLGGGFHGAVDPLAYRASDMGRYYDYMKQRSDAIDAADYEKLSAANKAYDEYAAQSMGLQSLNGQQQAVLNSFQELVSDETSPEDKIEAMEVLSALGSAGYKNYKEWLTRNGWDFSGKTFLENEKALNAYMKQRAKAIIDMQSKALKQSAEQAAKQYGAAGRNIDANVFTPQQIVAPAAANPVNNAAAVNTEDPKERNSYLDSLVNNALNIQPEEQKTGREESPESLNGLFSGEQKDIIGNTYVNMGQPMENGRGFIGNQAKLMAGDLETTCHYAVVEIDDLKVNEVQPRDRSGRLSSEDQIRRMAADFKPERVIDNSIDANNGPMVINSDMQVESGNGRISALKMAYNDQTGDGEYSGAELDPQYGKAAKYKQTLMVRAKEFGISADQIAGMKRPVLVRIRDNDPKISKSDFAVKSNTSQSMVMSASEQAKVDSEFMRKFVDDFASMNLDSTANVPFLRQFLEQVCSPSELNDMFDAKQEHLSANGKTRILNALFAAAYGEDPDILSMLSEVGNPVVDKLIAALKEAAADTVRLAGDVKNGQCYDVPLAKAIGEAVRKIRDIKSDPKLQGIIRDYGVAGAYLRQGLLNDDGMSPAGRLMLGILGGDYANNVKNMSDFIIDCNNVIRNAGNPKQPMLDGSYAPAPSAEDVVAAALKNNGYDQQTIDTWKQGPNIAAATGNTVNDAAYSVRNDGVTENQYHEDKWKKEYSKNNPDMKKVHAEDDLAHGQSMPANRETFAGDDIDFENLLDAIDDTGDPISFEELEREVDKIRKLIDPETGITIEVMHDSAELDKNAPKGGEGVNLNGRVILFSDNLTKQNWKRKLAHEILGHSTAKMLLGSKHFRYP